MSKRQVVELARGGPPIPQQSVPARTVQPAPRPGQDVAQPFPEGNLSNHKWVFVATEREAELADELAKQRERWVVRNGRFEQVVSEADVERAVVKVLAKLSASERRVLARKFAEAEALRKSESDPTRRAEGLLAKTDSGEGDVQRLGRNEGPRPRYAGALEYEVEGARRHDEGDDVQKNQDERVSYSDVFRQPVWTGSDFRPS